MSSGSKIFAQGVLTGSLTNTATGVTASIVRTVSMEVTSISGQPPATVAAAAAAPITTQAVCDILNLVLGPLHLDLLGLVVDLNQVVLNITAESGPGNLLGNLLCAITGLLDGTGTNATAIVDLLNRILGAIGL